MKKILFLSLGLVSLNTFAAGQLYVKLGDNNFVPLTNNNNVTVTTSCGLGNPTAPKPNNQIAIGSYANPQSSKLMGAATNCTVYLNLNQFSLYNLINNNISTKKINLGPQEGLENVTLSCVPNQSNMVPNNVLSFGIPGGTCYLSQAQELSL